MDSTKRKKGRPRKDNLDTNVEKEKKKRGRKKKENVEPEVKQKKKRGRKAAVKYFSSSIRKKIPLTTVIQDNNNYILHLDIDEDNNQVSENTVKHNDSILQTILETTGASFMKADIEDAENNESKDEDDESEVEHTEDSESNEHVEDIEDNESKDEVEDVDVEDTEDNLSKLYNNRIIFRENQDKILETRLQELHNNDDFISSLANKLESPNKDESVENNPEITQDQNRKRGYFELLYDFKQSSNWLHSTNINCWWCCHTFNDVPITLPIEYKDNTKKFRGKGIFCGFPCMIAYKNDNKIFEKDYLVKYLYKKLTGEPAPHKLPAAPPRYTLKMFGGDLSIDEFRNSTTQNKIYKLIEYPMFISRDYIEEVDINNVKNANIKLFDDNTFTKVMNLDEKRVKDAKLRLSSQIDKTTITIGKTIDQFIKIS